MYRQNERNYLQVMSQLHIASAFFLIGNSLIMLFLGVIYWACMGSSEAVLIADLVLEDSICTLSCCE